MQFNLHKRIDILQNITLKSTSVKIAIIFTMVTKRCSLSMTQQFVSSIYTLYSKGCLKTFSTTPLSMTAIFTLSKETFLKKSFPSLPQTPSLPFQRLSCLLNPCSQLSLEQILFKKGNLPHSFSPFLF